MFDRLEAIRPIASTLFKGTPTGEEQERNPYLAAQSMPRSQSTPWKRRGDERRAEERRRGERRRKERRTDDRRGGLRSAIERRQEERRAGDRRDGDRRRGDRRLTGSPRENNLLSSRVSPDRRNLRRPIIDDYA
ncbi:hypothetical protein CKO36_00640 [Rhabdochromatium marinum]|nr:hypothetical protein [Rhabdochromatium marinum]